MSRLAQSFPRAYRAVVSAFVALILGAQAFNVLGTILQKRSSGAWFWPIIDYPMYAMAGYEGESVDSEYQLIVVLDGGSSRPITKEELGLNVFHYRYLANDVIHGREVANIRESLGTVRDAARIREVRVVSSGQVITRDGVERRSPEVLGSVALGSQPVAP